MFLKYEEAKNEDITKLGKVNIFYYKQPSCYVLTFQKLVDPAIDVKECEECDFILKLTRPPSRVPFYSTLQFVAEQVRRMSTALVVIFNQPLYWNAIVDNEFENT